MTKPIIDGLTAKNAMESRDWPTNAERALEILIKADDIVWPLACSVKTVAPDDTDLSSVP